MSDSPESPAEEAAPKRRRGCWRWLVRLPVYLLLLVMALLVTAYLYVQSDGAKERARDILVARLSELLGDEVQVGSLDWSFDPLSVTATDVVIPSAWPGSRPFAVVPRVVIDGRIEGVRWNDWSTPVVAIEGIVLEQPDVYLAVREDGTNNIPRFGDPDRPPSERRIEVLLEGLLVEQGVFQLNEMKLPLDLEAESIYARLDGTGEQEGRELEGLVTAQGLVIQLPDGVPYRATVSAKGRFGPQRVALDAVRIAGPDLRLAGRGTFEIPEEERGLDLEVEASGQVYVAARLGYLDADDPPVRGPFRFAGSVLWTPDSWSASGPLVSERLVAPPRVIEDLSGTLSVTPERVRYEIDGVSHAGGTADGVVVVSYGDADGDGTSDTDVAVDLAVRRLALATLVADQGLELPDLAGRASGEVSYRFRPDDPLAGSGWANLDLTAAQGAGVPGRLALTGPVGLTIERGLVGVGTTRLVSASGRQRIEVSGIYDLTAQDGRFDFRLDSRDLGEVAALIPQGGDDEDASQTGDPEPAAWLPTSGTGRATGVLTFQGGELATRIDLDLADVVAPGLVAQELDGTVRLGVDGIRGLMLEAVHETGAPGALRVAGSLPFATGEPSGPGAPPFDLTVDLESWPADERLAAWLPVEIPGEGRVSGRVALSGAVEEPVGRAEIEMGAGTVAYGVELAGLSGALDITPDALVVERFVVDTGSGVVRGRGAIGRGDVATLDFSVRSDALDLGAEPLASRLGFEAQGVVEMAARIGGTLDRPQVDLEAEGTGLVLAGRSIGDAGDARLRLVWDGEDLQVAGGVPGLLELAGGGRLVLDGESAVEVRFASDRLGDVVRAVAPEAPPVAGGFAGVLVVDGRVTEPENLDLRLRLDELGLAYEGRTLENVEPVVARWAGDAVEIESFFLAEPTTSSELFVAGTVGLGEGQPLDLNLQGSLATSWLDLFVEGVDLDGTFDVLASVGGTLTQPAINGQGELKDGRYIPPDFPQSVEDLYALVLFYPREIVLDRLEGEIGRGDLLAYGRIQPYDPRGLQYEFQAVLEDLSMRYPEGFLIQGDAAATLASTPDGRRIQGSVDLERAFYLKDVEVSILQLLRRTLQVDRLDVQDTDGFGSTTQLAIDVSAPAGAVRVRNNVADLRGQADLLVRGTLARPVVFGDMEFAPGGTLVYAEDEFEVERARLTFADPTRIDPLIDLEAVTEKAQYEITLGLSGKVRTLEVELRSDPPLSDLDIVALLATGSTLGERQARRQAGESFDATAFLAGQAASAISDRVNTLFGFDQFRISPVGSDSGNSISSVGVTVGKQISSDVYVSYTENPASSEESFIQVEWRIDDDLTLVLTRQGDGTYRGAARWERRF
jgi:hypothetical protein